MVAGGSGARHTAQHSTQVVGLVRNGHLKLYSL